jgi:hypothetical protein
MSHYAALPKAVAQPDDQSVPLAIQGSEVPDCAYVPFFGAFGAAWDIVASWSANPLGCSGRSRMRRSCHRVTAVPPTVAQWS